MLPARHSCPPEYRWSPDSRQLEANTRAYRHLMLVPYPSIRTRRKGGSCVRELDLGLTAGHLGTVKVLFVLVPSRRRQQTGNDAADY